ncbi:unnamed protein product [Arctia plantaginis]|uniref:Uncharacterized protein n=1 Tax=Arctia plantaginis TaxID=874455 RepID=A0A8S0Z3E0_ARCPL|nr:unnamed protein product [Arctia plantaginis]CAB3261709.1 unnamed protein product [Arctia plantaginis]
MTEAQVGLLYNLAAIISKSQNNEKLKSYYLMRCKDITRGYGLPDKHFSSKKRCPNCCIEWTNRTEIKVRSIKLSRRQKQRLKSRKVTHNKKECIRRRKDLLNSNELEQICSFCKKSTITPILKPLKQKPNLSIEEKKIVPVETTNTTNKHKINNKKDKSKAKKAVNVYASALDVFSLKNKSNTLSSTITEKPKVIQNNKKKKDKFAGLCQKAVLASAKLKEKKSQQNKLSLFLKPSNKD